MAIYTKKDLAGRVLALLGETGFDPADLTLPAGAGKAPRSDLTLRILARLGETGFPTAGGLSAEPYTRQDLIRRTLVRFGEVGFGQSAEPEAEERIRTALPSILADLYADHVYAVDTSVTVPAEAMDALSAIVASRLSDDFAVLQDGIVTLAGRAQGAETKLKRLRFDFVARVNGVLTGVLSELAADHIYTPPSSTEIDISAMDALSAVTAFRLVDDFQIAADRVQVMASEAQTAQAKLKRLGFGFVRRVTDAMPGILDELEQDRVYDFGLDDTVPGPAMDPLAVIVASRLSTDFGLPPDQVALLASRAQGAEVRLRRYRALPYVHTPARPDYF